MIPLITVAEREEERSDGFLRKEGTRLFPIGFYENPATDGALNEMSMAGVNLVRCRDQAQLDQAQAAGLLGWIPLNVQDGPTDALRALVASLKDHAALAVWEGPDEIVWNFTAYSGLQQKAGFTRQDWERQAPRAIAYAEAEAKRIIPQMRAAIGLVRQLDESRRPFWINEAADSDVRYVRAYLDEIDITGCDFYPVKSASRNLPAVGQFTDRWSAVGRGKPVWMVLQAFSWHRVRPESHTAPRYPTFRESRFMAYNALAHGARGLLYWGSETVDDPAFRQSLYALTSELARLQPFLTASDESKPRIRLIEVNLDNLAVLGVRAVARRYHDDWLLILVNEDERHHQAVEVTGLEALNGCVLSQLYRPDTISVARGEIVTRIQPHEVQLFATGRQWESLWPGRDYGEPAAPLGPGPER